MQVRALVTPGVVWAEADEPLTELARRMRANRVGALPVRDGDRLLGIVTEQDIVQAVADGAAATALAGERMSPDPALVAPAEDCADAALRMLELGVRHLLVTEHGAVTGVVSARDLLMISAWPERVPPVAPRAAP
jgi:CBS domain-containing protein